MRLPGLCFFLERGRQAQQLVSHFGGTPWLTPDPRPCNLPEAQLSAFHRAPLPHLGTRVLRPSAHSLLARPAQCLMSSLRRACVLSWGTSKGPVPLTVLGQRGEPARP